MAANGTARSAELPDLLFLFDMRQHHLLPIDSTEIFFQKIFSTRFLPVSTFVSCHLWVRVVIFGKTSNRLLRNIANHFYAATPCTLTETYLVNFSLEQNVLLNVLSVKCVLTKNNSINTTKNII